MAAKKRKGRRALSPKKEKQLCERFLEGATYAVLVDEFKVGRATVQNVLKRHSVSADQRTGINNRGGAPKRESIGDAKQHRANSLQAFSDLEAPPDDPLSSMGWLRRVYMSMLHTVATDPNYPGNEAARRKEMRELGAAAAKCKDEDELARVRDMLNAARERREKRAGAEIKNGAPGSNKRARVRAPKRRPRSKQKSNPA